MGRYAEHTQVSAGRSREQIERLLRRYGADQFAYATSADRAMIGFILGGRKVQIAMPLPPMDEFTRTEKGRPRKRDAALQAWEQECRRRWRVLQQVILAKFEAIECGVTTLEAEFLAFMSLPGGETVGDHFIPQLEQVLQGTVQRLLPERRRG